MSNMAPLQSSRQLAAVHGVKVLVYGPAGAGKTKLVATAPSPVLFSAESGLLSLRQYDIATWVVEDLKQLHDAYNWVARSAEAKQFDTVCLDSVSDIAEKCLSAAKRANKDPRQAYGDLYDNMLLILKSFRDLTNKHVYFSAKMEAEKDGMTGALRYIASMPGQQLGRALPYLFDEVFYLGIAKTDAGQSYRYLRTGADPQYDAKDRSGVLDVYEPPDLTHIFNKIAGVK